MLGGFDKDGVWIKSVLTCSLTELLLSSSEISSDSDAVWHKITDVPVTISTCSAVNGELVAVGGRTNEESTAVHKYSPSTDSWDVISNIPTARCLCLVAVLPTNKDLMMVFGGYIDRCMTDTVEIASIQYT